MKKIYIASSNQEWNIGVDGITEEHRMELLADRIRYFLENGGGSVQVFRNKGNWSLQQMTNDANAKQTDIYVSNHSNAGGGEGTEIWYHYNTKTGDDLAKSIYKYLAPVSVGKDRGVKPDNILYPNGLHELRETDMPACLIEHFFHDNWTDIKDFNNNIDKFAEATAKGIYEHLGLKYTPIRPPEEKIMKKGKVYLEILEKYLETKNPNGLKDFKDINKIYIEEANTEGVDYDIAWVQMCHETDYLKFTGDVKPEQNNFCGLGATGNGVQGNSFKNMREGVRAHIQHLKAYASKDGLVNDLVDPRFKYVTRGSAPYVSDLSGKWATDPNYGKNIMTKYYELIKLNSSNDWRDRYFDFLVNEKNFIINEKNYDDTLTRDEFYVIMARWLGIDPP